VEGRNEMLPRKKGKVKKEEEGENIPPLPPPSTFSTSPHLLFDFFIFFILYSTSCAHHSNPFSKSLFSFLSLSSFLNQSYTMYLNSTIIALANTDSNYIIVDSSTISTNWRDSLIGLPLTTSYVVNPWQFHML
jgi:hypothetical protein